jgi:hypothetical protein
MQVNELFLALLPLIAVIYVFRNQIKAFCAKYIFLKVFADWAVREAEKQVLLIDKEKLRMAVELLDKRVKANFGIDLPEDLITEAVVFAWQKLVNKNLEIKKDKIIGETMDNIAFTLSTVSKTPNTKAK